LLELVVVGFFAAYSLSRLFVRNEVELAILISPALLLALWTVTIAAVVNLAVPLSAAWQPFWVAIFIATVAGVFLAVYDKPRPDLLTLLVPIGTASIVMAPYLIWGIDSFPGSWFWDGFAYMAAGESLWLHPRHESAAGLELFYQFGHKYAQTRYISSSIISMMKGIYPIGGDAQSAMGYFLLLCLFAFSSSCYFLAKAALPGRRYLQIAFVVVASVSGPLLNLVWANNFDHLLAMSIAPIIIALALILRWGSVGDAILLGLFVAAEVYIYPEMVALFVMPAGLILMVRLFRERKPREQIASATIAAATTLLLVAPAWSDLYAFFQNQIYTVASAASEAARPGNGYFPTFFTVVCGPGAWFGLFSPFAQCALRFADVIRFVVGLSCAVLVAFSFLAWRRTLALLISVAVSGAAASYFLVAKHYDYGAFKILETGWVPMLLFCTLGTIDLSLRMRRAAAAVAVAVLIVAVTQVVRFERSMPIKSILHYADLQEAVPNDGAVEVRIDNQLAFQWATYYLRNHQAVYSKGELLYYPASGVEQFPNRQPKYLVTDKPDGVPIWTNGKFYLYFSR
jgi:hypothetical protein